MRYLLLICLTAPTFFTAAKAHAGFVVKQQVRSTIDSHTTQSNHTWSIEGRKFHLTVKNDSGETIYLFNGRNFYVCSRLEPKQIEFLKKNELGDPELLSQFKDGACQAVPNNFMARFFLSPSAALESINQSDGMQLTLDVKDYHFHTEGKASNIHGSSCNEAVRGFAITKSGKDEESKAFTTKTKEKETLCLAPSIDWRQGLWPEVNKTVMRQPKSASLLNQLRSDQDQAKGLPLAYSGQVEATDSKGKAHKGLRTITTSSITKSDFSPKLFAVPRGYNLLSPENLTLLSKRDSKGKKAEKNAESTLETLSSVFFCAIAGALGCLSF